MKKILLLCLVLPCIFLCACGGEQVSEEAKQSFTSSASSASSTVSSSTAKDKTEASSAAAQKEETLAQYEELYGTTHRFTDAFVSQKTWLVGKENLVQVILAGGVKDVKTVPIENIERVEHTDVISFTTVTVYDKSQKGQVLTLSVKNEDLTDLLGMLQ